MHGVAFLPHIGDAALGKGADQLASDGQPHSSEQLLCSCWRFPCACWTLPCACRRLPCACWRLPCACWTLPCACRRLPCACERLTYASGGRRQLRDSSSDARAEQRRSHPPFHRGLVLRAFIEKKPAYAAWFEQVLTFGIPWA